MLIRKTGLIVYHIKHETRKIKFVESTHFVIFTRETIFGRFGFSKEASILIVDWSNEIEMSQWISFFQAGVYDFFAHEGDYRILCDSLARTLRVESRVR